MNVTKQMKNLHQKFLTDLSKHTTKKMKQTNKQLPCKLVVTRHLAPNSTQSKFYFIANELRTSLQTLKIIHGKKRWPASKQFYQKYLGGSDKGWFNLNNLSTISIST